MQQTTPREQALQTLEGLAHEINPERPPGPPDPEAHLEWDLGIGSLERMELNTRLEARLGHRLASQELLIARTVREILELVEAGPQETAQPARVRLLGGTIPPLPDHVATLVEMLEYQAHHQPDATRFVILKEDRVERTATFPELLKEVEGLATSLHELGVQPGDRVGIMQPTGFSFLALFFATLWRGAIPVPLYPPFRADQAEEYVKRQAAIMDNAGVKLLVSFARAWTIAGMLPMHSKHLKQVISVESLLGGKPIPRHPSTGDEVALIQYTSGSTGLPKGVTLTHANLLANVRAYGKGLKIVHSDVCVSWLPLYHDMGLIGSLFGAMYHGNPCVLMGPQDFLGRPSRWLRALSDYGGTITPAPNFAYEICARKLPESELEGLDLSRWRVAMNGSETVSPATLDRFSARFAPYGFRPEAHFPCYGLAEASLAVTFPKPGTGYRTDAVNRELLETQGRAEPGEGVTLVSNGFPLEDNELRIVDDQGRELPERRVGRLLFRSPSSLREYWGNPEATRAIKDPEGWVDTGDLGYLAGGELYLAGRKKDIILKAGRNLYPQDVEALASAVQGVRQGCVAAFGLPDPASGTELLVVVCEARKPPKDLAERVRAKVAQGLGVPPDRVLIVPPHSVPKTPSGKVRRSETRRLLETRQLGKSKPLARQLLRLGLSGLKGLRLRHLYGAWCVAVFALLAVVAGVTGKSRGLTRALLRAWRIPVRVEGDPHLARGCVVVSNHASVMDPLILIASLPAGLSFLTAPWVYEHPLMGRLIRKLGHLRASRGEPQETLALVAAIRAKLGANASLVAFPEGGLETAPGLRTFQLGVFQLAAQAGHPVVPVALRETRRVLPWPELIPHPQEVVVSIGPPLRAKGPTFEDALELARQCRAFIAQHCGEDVLDQRLRRED